MDIHVVSDGTCDTAERVVRSALAQFRDATSRLHRYSFTRSVDQVAKVVESAGEGSIVVYTFISPELGEAMVEMCSAHNLVAVNVLGQLVDFLADSMHHAPKLPRDIYQMQRQDTLEVNDAIHFTLRHDDGAGLGSLDQADLIILGVSRTGKTPTSIFLSCRKLRVANIPVIKDMSLPSELNSLETPKVGLTMDLERLVRLRAQRSSRFGTSLPDYAERTHVLAEMVHFKRACRSLKNYRTVDVTNRSIEETADWITHNVL